MTVKTSNKFKFEELPKEKWPFAANPPVQVFLSNKFMVQVYAERNGIYRLSILQIKQDRKTKTWVDGITWDELQEIKNRVGYSNYCAVEVYPEKHNVVNVAAIRHLWVLPERPEFAWRAQ